MRKLTNWIKKLFKIVREYDDKTIFAIIRYSGERIETISINKVVSSFYLPKIVAKFIDTNEIPDIPKMEKFFLVHYSDTENRIIAVYEPEDTK